MYVKHWNANNLTDPPSMDLLHKACLFDIDLTKDDEVNAMEFVWDKAAPAVLGCHSWGEATRHSTIMWGHKVAQSKGKQDQFTPAAMALIWIQCDNGYKKWRKMATHFRENPQCKYIDVD